MGTFTHGGYTADFDDRVLTHLQVVIVTRFRRDEPLMMSWIDGRSSGAGRTSLWLTPSVPVHFRFDGTRVPRIDEAWLRRLDAAASTATGLVVADEAGRPLRSAGRAGLIRYPRVPLRGDPE